MVDMRPALAAMAFAIAISGCAHLSTSFTCPTNGGVAWREVRSEHFVLRTDLYSGAAQDLARELERVHEAVRAGLFRTPPPIAGVIHVVALRTREEFDLFAPAGAAAFYEPSRYGEPTIVMRGVLAEAERVTLAHEITHHLLAGLYARQPVWFSEGLATMMETVGTSGPGNTPTVGGVPRHRLQLIYPYHGGIGEVLTVKRQLTSRQYALAWALVHFLVNTQAPAFAELQRRLARGQDPAVAWRELFPQWDPASPGGADRLDDELGHYVARGSFAYRDVHLSSGAPVTERPLTAADAHDVRLSLPWRNRGRPLPEGARGAEIAEALAEDPGSVAATNGAIARQLGSATALARRAAEHHPDDPRAWLLVAAHPSPPDDRESALRRALALDPENAFALNNLAWTLLEAGRSGEALPLARKAAKLAPWSPATLDTLAAVLEDLGQCSEALTTGHRAVDILPERLAEERRAPFYERVLRLEGNCGANQAPAGT